MSISMILIIVGLLLANAFFVGAEFAIISARRSAIEPQAEAGSKAAKTVLWAMEHVSLMLAMAQLGITVCSVSLGVVAEPALARAFEPLIVDLGLPAGVAHGVAVAIALFIIVGLHVVVGEMVPKNAAVSSPDRAALVFGPALVAIARIMKPLIAAMDWTANLFLRMFGVEPRAEVTSAFTADEVHSIVERSSEEGTISDPTGLLTGALEFSDRLAREVMVPLAAVATVDLAATAADIEAKLVETGFSRYPVVSNQDLVGYWHVKDTLAVSNGDWDRPMPRWRLRALAQVAPEAEVETALAQMRESGTHIAAVRNNGETLGVVFLEDIIEELVGEVRDSLAREDRGSASA